LTNAEFGFIQYSAFRIHSAFGILHSTFPMPRLIPVDVSSPPFQKIAIVGFGLIGGSLALAIRQRWTSALIIAVDRKDVLEMAMRMHVADVGGDDLVMAAEADLIVLAAPVVQNRRILEQLADVVPGDALVTDAGSTKQDIVTAARELPDRLRFVGGHPLAGAAAGGLRAARPDLFNNRPWVFTPTDQTREGDVTRLEQFVAALGAQPQRMPPEAHDRLVAFLSHLPQLTASALLHVVGSHAGAEGLALAGAGLRDTTRLASSPACIWRDIVRTNRAEIVAALDALIGVLEQLRADAAGGDGALEQIFDSAAAWKRVLGDEAPSE
jgi:prephenate dehydrogenase